MLRLFFANVYVAVLFWDLVVLSSFWCQKYIPVSVTISTTTVTVTTTSTPTYVLDTGNAITMTVMGNKKEKKIQEGGGGRELKRRT